MKDNDHKIEQAKDRAPEKCSLPKESLVTADGHWKYDIPTHMSH